MRLLQATLDTPLDSPFPATLSVHGLHFTVCAPSIIIIIIIIFMGLFSKGRVCLATDKSLEKFRSPEPLRFRKTRSRNEKPILGEFQGILGATLGIALTN